MFRIIYFEYGSNYFFWIINNFVKYVLYVDPHKMIPYVKY